MNLSSTTLLLIAIGILVVGAGSAAFYFTNQTSESACILGTGEMVRVVAAENFWGSLVSQLGGSHVSVLSIVSDPNVDPHEYESNSADAQAISSACLVIVNGAGYDQWALSLIAAGNNPGQTILNVQQSLGLQVDVNPHLWYSPYYVNDTIRAMYRDLVSIDPGDSSYYRQQYLSLNISVGEYNVRIHEIASQFAGTKVAATEDIFVYLANATRLDLISPPAFMQAVAEGNDPPASSVAEFQQQLQNKSVTVLVYNDQTVTPLTENMKSLAAQNNITTVPVTETIQPPDVTFQLWMSGELIALQNALHANTLGK